MILWKNRGRQLGCLLLALLILSGCGSSNNARVSDSSKQETEQRMEKNAKDAEKEEDSSGKILIAYFTLADNYEDPSGMDATSQASINIEDKDLIGNTEYLANVIQAETGGDLFSVVVKNLYPNDYDRIVDMGSEEQGEDARPELASHVDNMEQYETIFIGYPIWWGEAPAIIHTFLESYQWNHKMIVPFCTAISSNIGSSGTNLEPSAVGNSVWLSGRRLERNISKKEVENGIIKLDIS